jgi:predicted O-methyltransferase YrrM
MALSSSELQGLIFLRRSGTLSNAGLVMEIGAQQLSNGFLRESRKIKELQQLFGLNEPYQLPAERPSVFFNDYELLAVDAPRSTDFWRWLGFRYSSIDIDGSPDAICLDLNYDDVPSWARDQFDLVVNAGTTEHVANQINAFKIMHDLLKVGGVVIHSLPAQGMMNHGLVNYNPKFFWMLARSNEYKTVYFDYFSETTMQSIPDDLIGSVSTFRPDIRRRAARYRVTNAGMVVALQKQFDTEFIPPLDVNTGATTDNQQLKTRYWTVFDPAPNALQDLVAWNAMVREAQTEMEAEFAARKTRRHSLHYRLSEILHAISPGIGIWRGIHRIALAAYSSPTLGPDALVESDQTGGDPKGDSSDGVNLMLGTTQLLSNERLDQAIANTEEFPVTAHCSDEPATAVNERNGSQFVPYQFPIPIIDLSVVNPVPSIMSSSNFNAIERGILATEASRRSLISAASAALIYCLVRNTKPEHVLEIGTFNGGTSEVICMALHENGSGVLHTLGPFDDHRVVPIFETWPDELRRHLKFYPITSMDFYIEMNKKRIQPNIVFVDGDHAYESALFDIQCAAQSIRRGGFIIVDNVSQAGPYYAVMDFLDRNPEWTRCKVREPKWADPMKAFDRERTSIPETDFEILRAPSGFQIAGRPTSFGEIPSGSTVSGLRVNIDREADGTLHAQCILRSFGRNPTEQVVSTSCRVQQSGPLDLVFVAPLTAEGSHYTTEPWLTWVGDVPLCLVEVPEIISSMST